MILITHLESSVSAEKPLRMIYDGDGIPVAQVKEGGVITLKMTVMIDNKSICPRPQPGTPMSSFIAALVPYLPDEERRRILIACCAARLIGQQALPNNSLASLPVEA